MINFITGDGIYNKTAVAGTRIQTPIGGLSTKMFTHLTSLSYTPGTINGAVDHTITAMRGASHSSVVSDVAAAGTSVPTSAKLTDGDGNDIAASDVLAMQMDDGRWHVSTVSTLDTPKTTITLTTAVPTGRTLLQGSKIINYGVAGDTIHARHQIACVGGQEKVVGGGGDSYLKAFSTSEPIVIDSPNTSYAGTINYATAGYTDR